MQPARVQSAKARFKNPAYSSQSSPVSLEESESQTYQLLGWRNSVTTVLSYHVNHFVINLLDVITKAT